MRHLVTLFAVLMFAVLALPAVAQAPIATPAVPVTVNVEPSPAPVIEQPQYGGFTASEVVLIAVLLIVVAGGGFILVHYTKLAVALRDTIPPSMLPMIKAFFDTGITQLRTVVAATPNTVDDDLYQRVSKLEQQFFMALNPTVSPDAPPTPSPITLPPTDTAPASTPAG